MSDVEDYINIRLRGVLNAGASADGAAPDKARFAGGGQIPYFAKAATREQAKGRFYQNIQIGAAAATPLLIGSAEMLDEYATLLRWLSLMTSFAVAVATGVLSVRRHWEVGVNFRTREQQLISELYLWEQGAGHYSPENLDHLQVEKDVLLVENCEQIIQDDLKYWSERMKNASSRVKKGG